MKDTISKIRDLLDTLALEAEREEKTETLRVFSGLELPDILRDVVDLLLPDLRPYEANFYFYMLRHSVLETGDPYIRVSRRGLQSGVIKSAYSGTSKGMTNKDEVSGALSYATVKATLEGLEAAGAIRRESDADKDGTLYRVLLPEEIQTCQDRRRARRKAAPSAASENEADFYNVRENRLKVYDRDSYKCQYCSKQLTRFTATLDHVQSVKDGGDNSLTNLVTACRECNSKKNAKLLGDFIADTSPT